MRGRIERVPRGIRDGHHSQRGTTRARSKLESSTSFPEEASSGEPLPRDLRAERRRAGAAAAAAAAAAAVAGRQQVVQASISTISGGGRQDVTYS